MEAVVEELSAMVGLRPSMILFIAALIMSVPAALVARYVKPGITRHVYNAASGMLLCYVAYGAWPLAMLVIPCCCAYVMTALLGRHAGRVVAIVSLGYLLKCHVVQDSLLWRRGDIDNSGTMMLLVLKMITVAYCVSDGIKFKSKKDAPRNDRLRAIADGQMRRSLHAMPGPIAYFGYLFNCGSCLCGPYHEIGDYAAWTEARGEWAPGSNFYASRRSRWRAAGIALCKLSACVVLHLIIDAKVKPHTVNETQTGVLGKVGLAHLVCLSARMRFYFVWILGELGGILSGLAYTADGTWSRLRNQDILGIEFCTSCAMLPIGWNIQVSLWLRHYAYERYLQHGIGSDAAVLLTQLVSTIWHGVYPGYLIFFVTSALCIQASKLIHRRTSGLRGTSKSMLQPFLYLLTQIQNSCAGFSFVVLLWKDSIEFFKSIYFLNFALMIATFVLDALLPRPRKVKHQKQQRVLEPASNDNGKANGVSEKKAQ